MNMLNPILARLNKMPRAALITIGLFVALGTFAPWLAPQDPSTQNLLDAGLGPSAAHWLGTDHLGRDTFSRLIIAANTSLVSVGSVLGVAMTIGILLGTIAGYHRGWVDDLLMRVVDVGLNHRNSAGVDVSLGCTDERLKLALAARRNAHVKVPLNRAFTT